MRLSKNDILEIISCLLLVLIILLSYSNEKREFFTGFLILVSIGVFSLITYFSTDEKERELQKAHVSRLTKNKCTPQAGMIFSDVVSGLERVADHATNIAFSIKEKDGVKYLD